AAPMLSREAAEQFGKALEIEVGRGFEQALEEARGLAPETVARETRGNQGIVVRPDRAVVVAHRIVSRLGRGDGAYAPSGKRRAVHQCPDHRGGALAIGKAGEQDMAGIRAPYPAGFLVAVEGEHVGPKLWIEELLVEA